MMPTPRLVLFDVNETLSNLEPLRDRFEEVGAPGDLAGLVHLVERQLSVDELRRWKPAPEPHSTRRASSAARRRNA